MDGSVSAFERWWLDTWPHRLHVRRLVPRFLRACPEPFRGEVLEVGAGSGWTSRRILETFPQVELTATDLDPRTKGQFERLEATYGQRLRWQHADLLALPFDRESFDIVVAIHMMHHVNDLNQAIQQLWRVTRPGGLIGLTDENPAYMRGPLRWLFPASSRPTRRELEDLLRQEGCEILASHGELHYYVWARKPYPVRPR